ncbi:MAG: type III pantothenate kinase [Clostridia bacterium]
MILTIDVGNTNIVFGCVDENKIYFVSRISTDFKKTKDQYAIEIKQILQLYQIDFQAITGSIISSVVPPLKNVLQEAVNFITSKDPLIVGPGVKTGLNIIIDNPAQLGSDLVVSAVAALAEYTKPIVIFDIGTATTVSVIDAKGAFLGGAIMPGIAISMDALSAKATQLQGISLEAPKRLIGKNTVDSMTSGIIYGNAAMVDGMCTRIEAELGSPATVLATGGLAHLLVDFCEHKVIYDADLMLKGLFLIYQKNTST